MKLWEYAYSPVICVMRKGDLISVNLWEVQDDDLWVYSEIEPVFYEDIIENGEIIELVPVAALHKMPLPRFKKT